MNVMILDSRPYDNMCKDIVLPIWYILNTVPHKKLDQTPYEL